MLISLMFWYYFASVFALLLKGSRIHHHPACPELACCALPLNRVALAAVTANSAAETTNTPLCRANSRTPSP
eukprot:6200248-Pleurochrysis_carterae.AAC.2